MANIQVTQAKADYHAQAPLSGAAPCGTMTRDGGVQSMSLFVVLLVGFKPSPTGHSAMVPKVRALPKMHPIIVKCSFNQW